MLRKASAVWNGGLKDGNGKFSMDSGILSGVPYDFRKRFETEPGTNPEELVAAAHASCFAMAFANELSKLGMSPESVSASCTITFEEATVKQSHLEVTAKVPGADKAKFDQAADAAKKGCPISRLLNTNITLNAKLA